MTPSETETLKMFRERFPLPWDYSKKEESEYFLNTKREDIETFWLTQLRLARADERKQAYEDGKNAALINMKEKIKYLPFDGMSHDKPFCMGYAQARKDFIKAI